MEKEQKLSNKKLGAAIIGVFIVGFAIGSTATPRPEELQKQVDALTSENETLKDRTNTFAKLKSSDDLSFQYCAESVSNMSNGINAYMKGDLSAVLTITEKMKSLNEKIELQALDRSSILKELGY